MKVIWTFKNGTMHTAPGITLFDVQRAGGGALLFHTANRFNARTREDVIESRFLVNVLIEIEPCDYEVAAGAPEAVSDSADPAVHAGPHGARGKDGAR